MRHDWLVFSVHLLTPLPRWLAFHQQALVAGVVVLSVLAASLGVPIILEPQRDLSRPFPCMHHRCGCASADACWQSCCCMTSAQRLAWAKEHGVTPPDYVLAQAEHEEHGEIESPHSCGSCSQHHGCESTAKPVAQTAIDGPQDSATMGLGLVLSEDFRRCNGLASLWLTIGHALPPKVESNAPRYKPAPVSRLAVTSHTAESPPLFPATPPPRHS